MNYIDPYSWKCLLGPMAKDIKIEDEFYSWRVGKKKHFTTSRELNSNDLSKLQNLKEANFHYISDQNLNILKQFGKVYKHKTTSISIDIEKLSLIGNQAKSIRNSLNKCKKHNFEILNDFKKLTDVEDLIEEWSNLYTDKYFRDFSGKNYFFFKNNFHQDCCKIFIYDTERLLAYGVLSPPRDGYSSYIIGKALYQRYSGLSEFADITLYEKGKEQGVKVVNLGMANQGMVFYKSKFNSSFSEETYDGSIQI